MKLAEPAHLQEFRASVRAFLRELLPAAWTGSVADPDEDWAFSRKIIRAMGTRGWNTPTWPIDEGGAGLSPWEHAALNEETGFALAPIKSTVISSGFAGPTIRVYGTPEQRSRFLPEIASGDAVWCQGFSEPDAGSDLASIKTTATRRGDDFVVNGRKIWTSFAHHSQWMLLLARTDASAPKHKGITYFVVPVDAEGITILPLANMSGNVRFNEVTFDNVRIPAENVIGRVNEGWYVATTTLDFERSSIATFGLARRKLFDAVQLLSASGMERKLYQRHAAADLAIALAVGRTLAHRVVAEQEAGVIPSVAASQAKLFASELNQRVAMFQLSVRGLQAQVRSSNQLVVDDLDPTTSLLESVATTIAGGTSEIQRNIISQRGLGLPRGG